MLIYSSTKRQFDRDVVNGSIARKIERQFYLHGINHNNDSEVTAWNNSLLEMQKVLSHPGFDDSIQVAIEYQMRDTGYVVPFYAFYKYLKTDEKGVRQYAKTMVPAVRVEGLKEYFQEQTKYHS